jgi:hypothetical protein
MAGGETWREVASEVRKLHLAVDAASGMIVAQTLTDQDADSTSTAYWQGWNRLCATMGGKFHMLFDAVSRVIAQTPRSSSLVENLNSRLKPVFQNMSTAVSSASPTVAI